MNLLQETERAYALASQGQLPVIELFSITQLLIDQKHLDIAIQLYQLWLERTKSPINYAVQFNLAVALTNADDDISAENAYKQALEQKPDFLEASLNLGTLLERTGRAEQALSLWHETLALVSKDLKNESLYVELLNNLGRLLEIEKQLPEAEAILTLSLRQNSKQPHAIVHWVHLRQKLCLWPIYKCKAVNTTQKKLIEGTSPLAMLSAFDDPELQLKTASRYVKEKVLSGVPYLSTKNSYGHTRLRIAYLSSDFCSHAVSILTAELYGLHDRSQFEVYGFCWSRVDGSSLQARVIAGMDHHIKIGDLNDEEAAKLIRSHEIDILIDLHGLTLGSRHDILSYRPAPLQLTWLGFPGSTALPEIDYVLCDSFVFPPELEPYFSEKPLRLPQVFQVNDRQRLISPRPTRESCGLPEEAFVFCSFNNTYKITPEVFKVWMRILKRVPQSILWLIADNVTVRTNLYEQAKKQGISTDRILFAERALPSDYLARFQVADLFLDTFPFGGGTTASDALWAGLPFLTYSGKTFASRMAGSLLNAVELTELITYSLSEYENKAVELANQPERIEVMKQHLIDNRMSFALFDTPRFVRDLEQVLEQVVYPSQLTKVDPNLIKPIKPRFSIIIATHNRPQLLNRAIQSIKNQTYQDYQIIVVSDSNCKETYQMASKLMHADDVFIQRCGKPGPAASRNLGMTLITGDYFIFLDDDDTFREDFLENVVIQIQNSSCLEQIYYTNFEVIYENSNDKGCINTEIQVIDIGVYEPSSLYVKNFIPNNCLIFSKTLASNITFDTDIAYEDWDFTLSACAYFPLMHLPIFGPRIHKYTNAGSIQRGKSNEDGLIDCYIKIYGKHPPINQLIAAQRKEFFSFSNLDIDTLSNNLPLTWIIDENTTFNVCYLIPVFKDVAEVIYHGLLELGFAVFFNQSTIINDSRNIIFGAHLITDRNTIPSDSIIFNLEQLSSDSHYCNDIYLDTLKTYQVWDYSQRNIAWLNQHNNSTAQLIPIGYSKDINRIPKAETQDIDVLFYGAVNERRANILDELRIVGLNVVSLIGCFGNELETYISRSKVVLNLHYYDNKIFEIVRVSYLLNNKKAVVAEVSVDTEIEPDIREAIIGVDYDELVNACIRVVQDDALRLMIEEKAFSIFSTRSQSKLLKKIIYG